MVEIVYGDGDLIKCLEVKSNDEIGVFVIEFNIFIDKLRLLLKDIVVNIKVVFDVVDYFWDVSYVISKEIN